jgi:hypothetical protein
MANTRARKVMAITQLHTCDMTLEPSNPFDSAIALSTQKNKIQHVIPVTYCTVLRAGLIGERVLLTIFGAYSERQPEKKTGGASTASFRFKYGDGQR